MPRRRWVNLEAGWRRTEATERHELGRRPAPTARERKERRQLEQRAEKAVWVPPRRLAPRQSGRR